VKRVSVEAQNLQQEIPALEITLKNQKEKLRLQHMNEKLKLNEDHMLTINTMQDTHTLNMHTMQAAIANLNDYVTSLKKEIRKLKSIKGLNANARVFNPNSGVLTQANSTSISGGSLKDQQITVLSNLQRADHRHNNVVNKSADGVLHMSPGMPPDPRNIASKPATSQGSSGVTTSARKQRKRKKKKKRKSSSSRKSDLHEENKYLAMSSTSSLKHQPKQMTSTRNYNKRVQKNGQSTLKYIAQNSSQTPEQGQQYKLKGLMMGPHDPSFQCPPPTARKYKKKNKRNCYHKSKD